MDNSNNGNGGPPSGGHAGGDQGAVHCVHPGVGGHGGLDQGVGGSVDQVRTPGHSEAEGGGMGSGAGGHQQQHVVVVDVHEGDLNGTISNENFSEIEKEGTKVYECNICSEHFDQASGARRHITMKHLKPANDSLKHMKSAASDSKGKRVREEDLEILENKKHKFIFSESMLEEFDRTGMFISSTQVGDVNLDDIDIVVDEEEPTLEETIIRARPENVDAAMEIIKELDLKVKQLEEE
jgi:hypothetical protein